LTSIKPSSTEFQQFFAVSGELSPSGDAVAQPSGQSDVCKKKEKMPILGLHFGAGSCILILIKAVRGGNNCPCDFSGILFFV
jgi:hypothetical protein